jgi:hypothetical protein
MASEFVEDMRQAEPEPEPELAATSTLCWKCFSLLYKKKRANKLITDGHVPFQRTWKYLLKKTRKGCEFCTMISSKIQDMKDGSMKVDELTDEALPRNMEFELRGARIDRGEERLGNKMANFAASELLRVELHVQQEGNFQWERIEQFNVAANGGNLRLHSWSFI